MPWEYEYKMVWVLTEMSMKENTRDSVYISSYDKGKKKKLWLRWLTNQAVFASQVLIL